MWIRFNKSHPHATEFVVELNLLKSVAFQFVLQIFTADCTSAMYTDKICSESASKSAAEKSAMVTLKDHQLCSPTDYSKLSGFPPRTTCHHVIFRGPLKQNRILEQGNHKS